MSSPILIIEDDPDIAEVLCYSLKAQSFEPRVALTGEEGLSASLDADNRPLLILLDLLLPGMNGLEICRRLRAEPATARIPIVMVTAKVSAVDAARARAAGVDDYITKPFSLDELMERIGVLLKIG
jgi:DNA-binding response OmpR family regulator